MFIRLNSIAIFAHHGVYAEEIKNGNNFEIDLEIETDDSPAANTDNLNDALDYTKFYDAVILVSEGKRYNLLETFASDVCKEIFNVYINIRSVGVKVRKIDPPVRGKMKSVEIEIKKRR